MNPFFFQQQQGFSPYAPPLSPSGQPYASPYGSPFGSPVAPRHAPAQPAQLQYASPPGVPAGAVRPAVPPTVSDPKPKASDESTTPLQQGKIKARRRSRGRLQLPESLVARVRKQAMRFEHLPAVHVVSKAGTDSPVTWSELWQGVCAVGKTLLALNLPAGSRVGLLANSGLSWVQMYLGAMAVGAVPTTLFANASAPDLRFVVDHAEITHVLVQDAAQWTALSSALGAAAAKRVSMVVLATGDADQDDEKVRSWAQFLALGDTVTDAQLEGRLYLLDPDDQAVLIYTPGTTGVPRGVRLTHRNLIWTSENLVKAVLRGCSHSDTIFAPAPLAHVRSQVLNIGVPAVSGMSVFLSRDVVDHVDYVGAILPRVRPTVLFGPTGVFNLLAQELIVVDAEEQSAATPAVALERLGLDRCKYAGCGGPGALLPRARAALAKHAVPVLEFYGLTEASGFVSINRVERSRDGTHGPVFPGVQIRMSEAGEIQIRGPNVCLGYRKDKDQTAALLKDGWLRTGDLGEFDQDGFLTFQGRLADAHPDGFHPHSVEAAMAGHHRVHAAMVVDDAGKKMLLVELTPGDRDRDEEALVREIVADVRASLADRWAGDLTRVHIVRDPLDMHAGELTPANQPRRAVVQENRAGVQQSIAL